VVERETGPTTSVERSEERVGHGGWKRVAAIITWFHHSVAEVGDGFRVARDSAVFGIYPFQNRLRPSPHAQAKVHKEATKPVRDVALLRPDCERAAEGYCTRLDS